MNYWEKIRWRSKRWRYYPIWRNIPSQYQYQWIVAITIQYESLRLILASITCPRRFEGILRDWPPHSLPGRRSCPAGGPTPPRTSFLCLQPIPGCPAGAPRWSLWTFRLRGELWPGLAIKKPTQKNQKNPPKKTTKNVFLFFLVFFNF